MCCSMGLALSHLKLYVLEVGRGEEDVLLESVKKGAVPFFYFMFFVFCFAFREQGKCRFGEVWKIQWLPSLLTDHFFQTPTPPFIYTLVNESVTEDNSFLQFQTTFARYLVFSLFPSCHFCFTNGSFSFFFSFFLFFSPEKSPNIFH